MTKYVNKKVINKDANKVQVLSAIDMIKPIETGMNKAPIGERTKKKIVRGINPF